MYNVHSQFIPRLMVHGLKEINVALVPTTLRGKSFELLFFSSFALRFA
jgi:hypothetical protein